MQKWDSILYAANSTVLNSSGYGWIRFAPQGELWEIQGVTMQCSDFAAPTLEATGRIYTDVIAPLNIRAVSMAASTGSSASAAGDPIRLTDGQAVYFEWTGGTPGVTAYVTFRGIRTDPRGGFRAVR